MRGRARLETAELPARRWAQDYKELLMEQLPTKEDQKTAVTEIRERHMRSSMHFVLHDAREGRGG